MGSRTIELVVVEGETVVRRRLLDTSVHPLRQLDELARDRDWDRLTATGYGRSLARDRLDAAVVTEIKAYAAAAHRLHPGIGTVLDIGGQDMKVIVLDGSGLVERFEMNDKCSAGTGRFLEIMAMKLGVSVEGLGEAALRSRKDLEINHTCTVFAESEVVSLVGRDAGRDDIAMAVCRSAAARARGMVMKLSPGPGAILFAGGVALNPCMRTLLGALTGRPIVVPAEPQFMGALGAALSSSREASCP